MHNIDGTMILIIENDPEVPPGILTRLLDNEARAYRISRPHAGERWGDLAGVGALVVLGGAMSTCDRERFPFLIEVMRLMERTIRANLPLLGICLGGQLLAEVMGGKVFEKTNGERGLHDIVLSGEGRQDPLFSGLPEMFTVFQWHSDSFVPPDGATVLARSARCPHQAFRYGKHAYGIQFHPEVDEFMVADWSAGVPSATAVQQAFAGHRLARLDWPSTRLLKNFIQMTQPVR